MKQQRKKGESISACYSPVKHQAMIHKFFFSFYIFACTEDDPKVRLHWKRKWLEAYQMSHRNRSRYIAMTHRHGKCCVNAPLEWNPNALRHFTMPPNDFSFATKTELNVWLHVGKALDDRFFFSNHQTNFPISSISMAFFGEASFFQATLSLSTAQHITRKKSTQTLAN